MRTRPNPRGPRDGRGRRSPRPGRPARRRDVPRPHAPRDRPCRYPGRRRSPAADRRGRTTRPGDRGRPGARPGGRRSAGRLAPGRPVVSSKAEVVAVPVLDRGRLAAECVAEAGAIAEDARVADGRSRRTRGPAAPGLGPFRPDLAVPQQGDEARRLPAPGRQVHRQPERRHGRAGREPRSSKRRPAGPRPVRVSRIRSADSPAAGTGRGSTPARRPRRAARGPARRRSPPRPRREGHRPSQAVGLVATGSASPSASRKRPRFQGEAGPQAGNHRAGRNRLLEAGQASRRSRTVAASRNRLRRAGIGVKGEGHEQVSASRSRNASNARQTGPIGRSRVEDR